MLELIIICLLAGTLGGLLQGMVGIGTGIVIVPLLTFILPHYGISQNIAIHIALATSMAAIAINSISALISHHSHGNVQWLLFKKTILFSIIGASLGALVASDLSGRYLEIIFGIFLLTIAIYMLFKKSTLDEIETTAHLSFPKMATGGLSIGFAASIVGSGGGVLMVPFLHSQKIKMRYAVGTSTLIGFPVAICGTFTYVITGLSKMPSTPDTIGYLHWPALLAISAAGIFSIPLGVKLATVLPTQILQRLFAICMILISIKMLTNI